MSKPAKRPRGRPRAFDRDVALTQAMQLFWDRGYEGTALDDLTAAMGISPSSLYAVFGDKEQLFKAAVDQYLAGPGGYSARILAEEPTARGAVARLLSMAAQELTHPKRPAGCMVALSSTHGSPAAKSIRATLQRYRHGARDALQARIQKGITAGELPAASNAAEIGNFYLATLFGMSVQARDGATRDELLATAQFAMRAWPA
ncbi:MAG TPA: TetR/AcrR family transcriptional regulator [Planctomycetota bacterium]|nr:TetR/AcrR family transcriptional regulator [Planctomycetota bacterium]